MTGDLQKTIADELKLLYPDLKPYQVDRYAEKYVRGVVSELSKWHHNPRNDHFSVDSRELNRLCGRMADNSYLFAFMDRSDRTRLVDVRYRGNTGFYKQVVPSARYHEQLMDLIGNKMTESISPINKKMQDLSSDATDWVPVDLDSLTSFMAHTQERLAQADSSLKSAMLDDIAQARQITGMSQQRAGQWWFPEVYRSADSGRRYGLNNSLQRQNSRVRAAALGHCHRYDFKTNSYAVMTSLALNIDPNLRVGSILDFIQYRSQRREQIAAATGLPVSVIKQVFTAVGFGAEAQDNPHKALRRLIKSQSRFEALINNETFLWIQEDFQKVNDTIAGHFPEGDFEFLMGCQYHHLRDSGRRKSTNQRLAWIYQNVESYLLKTSVDHIQQHTGQRPLLCVHDCMYYRQPVPKSVLEDLMFQIREQFALVALEHTSIWPIGTQQRYDDLEQEWQREEQEHRARIQQEELAARGFQMPQWTGVKMPTQQQLDEQRWQQQRARIDSGPDVGDYEYELD